MGSLKRRGLLASVAAAGGAALAATLIPLASSPAGAATSGFTASQSVTNRDDSGANGGNWATDNFTRTLNLYGKGLVANSYCPGIAYGACHYIVGKVTDNGHFTTVIGNPVPGKGSLNGGAVPDIGTAITGPMRGGILYSFYVNIPLTAFSASNAPASVSGDSPSTGQWPEQFAPSSYQGHPVQFWDSSGNTGGSEYLAGNGGWTYTEAPGANPACPHESSQWVDASPDWGGSPADGNILAQDSLNC